MASPLVDQFRRGGISREVRLTAASGSLPLKPNDQVELLYLLSRDADAGVRDQATASLMRLPEESLGTVFTDATTSPEVLHFFATRTDSPALLQAIVQNRSTEDATIEAVAEQLSQDVLELVVVNQTRMLRHPGILPRVEANPNLSFDQRRRIEELKHDFKLVPAPVTSLSSAETFVDLGAGPPEDDAALSFQEALDLFAGEDPELPENLRAERQTLIQRLALMNAAEKMIEALQGDREARRALVRDRNRAVYAAVLSSPKLTDSEIDSFVAMKNVSPEVLRIIGARRDWTRRYNVARDLVKNPLTPVEVSMQLIHRLTPRDMKQLKGDRNVPEAVRRQATKIARSGP